jgi:hypothetical protein
LPSQTVTLRLLEKLRPDKRIFLALDDFGDDIIFNIQDKDGNPKNLGGITPNFQIWGHGSKPFLDAECTVTDSVNGQCKYNRKETDITKTGSFLSKVLLKTGVSKNESTERLLVVVQE